MLLALGQHCIAGQMPVVIQQQMQLHGPFGAAKLRPIKHRRAQANHRRIQTQQLVFEAELPLRLSRLAGHHALTLLQQLLKDRLIQRPGPVFIGIRQSGPRRRGG